MSRSVLRIRVRRARPSLLRRFIRACWRTLRIFLMAGAALGPAMPPPPPPPRPTAELQVSGGKLHEEE